MAEVEKQQVKSRRQSMMERLQGRYPEKDFSDEEAVFGQISDDYDEYDQNIAGYQEREKAFSDMFTSDPRSASFINSWRQGENPVIALVRRFGKDIKDVIEDPEWQKEVEEADKDFAERVAKEKELNDLYEANKEETIKTRDAYQEEHGLSDEQIDAAIALLKNVANDIVVGKITTETLDMAFKAINHDADVENANQEGLVQGKNTKVEEKLRKPKSGDGTAPLGGANGTAKPPRTRPSLGALDGYGDNNKTIWERGNEKRRRES